MTSPDTAPAVEAPMQGTIVRVEVGEGDLVATGQQVLVIESMKMEHVIGAEWSGVVRRIAVSVGETVQPGQPLVFIEAADVPAALAADETAVDPDAIRPDLADVLERHSLGLDEARPDAVERRRRTGQRTTRENVDDLCDP